jgi:FlaA1/EpsC-like NDP-sugar epimerase
MRKEGLSYRGVRILITGGTGSVGLELARIALQYDPKQICLFSNDENGLFEARSIFGKDREVHYTLGDIRDRASVEGAVADSDIVFHAAALKHVDFCESNPYEAIYTNIIGAQTVIDCAIRNRVSRFVYVGTDKAVNPISTMGATKLLGEKLTASASRSSKKTIFSCVRFGNVLGSRGSVLRIFERQVRDEESMTVTNPEMTRFIMLPSEAAKLVLRAAEVARSGEILVLKMPAVRIGDLAEVSREFFARLFRKQPDRIRIKFVGSNPGEKLHEELITPAEGFRVHVKSDFYIIRPESARDRLPARRPLPTGIASNLVPRLPKSEIASILSTLYKPWFS